MVDSIYADSIRIDGRGKAEICDEKKVTGKLNKVVNS